MLSTLTQLAPVLICLAIGFSLKRAGFVTKAEGEFVFRLLFYTGVPALVFSVLSSAKIEGELLVFPIAAVCAVVGGYVAGKLMLRLTSLQATQRTVFVMACMIVNSGFVLPFVDALYGAEGLARFAAFDAVIALLTYSWVHAIAARSHDVHEVETFFLRRVVTSPPLYAIVAGILVNVTGVHVPEAITLTAQKVGGITPTLLALAIGIVFAPAMENIRASALAIATRSAVSIAIMSTIILAFDLEGIDAGIILLIAVAPVGFNTVTLASIEKLDVEFASRTLSLSLAIATINCVAVSLIVG